MNEPDTRTPKALGREFCRCEEGRCSKWGHS